jgi:murein L,D-transpeptidase YcbB/YkuD
LLADGPAGASQLDALIEARDTQTLTLARPMPVEVLYLTAMPSPDGTIRYFGDPYGQDARLAEMLDSR